MTNSKVARRYTLALYGVAEETKVLDKVQQDFINLKSLIEESSDLRLFLSTPIINSEKKAQVLKAMFDGKYNDLSVKFFGIIAEKNRAALLYDIVLDFLSLLNEKRGILEAEIKTAVEISDKEQKLIKERLNKYAGKEITAKYSVDPSIKGGFIAQIGDKIIDASIQRQLELLREEMMKGSFKLN